MTTRPFQPEARIAAWCSSVSSGLSVVAITSMLKRSKSARGRNAGVASDALIASKIASALAGDRRSRMPNTVENAWSSHSRVGVPWNTCQCAANVRQIFRASVSTGPPSCRGMPSDSRLTPWL